MVLLARDLSHTYRREREKSTQLREALDELEETYAATVRMLAFVIEAKDPHVRSHLERSFQYAKALAMRVDPSLMSDRGVEYGFLLHDIGKVGIPEGILGKTGALTGDEWQVMRTHPMIGGRIVAPVRVLASAAPVIEAHHERWDGEGYPRRLRGEQIPLAARIFAIADSFDAMTSDRPYRKALTIEQALDEIHLHGGTQFDPALAEQFIAMDWTGSTQHGSSH